MASTCHRHAVCLLGLLLCSAAAIAQSSEPRDPNAPQPSTRLPERAESQAETGSDGSRPDSVDTDPAPVVTTTGISIAFEHPDSLPLPGTAELLVRATDQLGQPVARGRISLAWKRNDLLREAPVTGTLDARGELRVPLDLRIPAALGALPVDPPELALRLDVTVTSEDGGQPITDGLSLPIDAALIVGRTVGPDMQPRPESAPPELRGIPPAMVLARWHDDRGEFRLLVTPPHSGTGEIQPVWRLAWGPTDRLPLDWPLPTPPAPGSVTDVGSIDVLTPDEHNQRLRAAVAEFAAAMPLTPDQQTELQAALGRLVFVDGSTADVPFYQDDRSQESGSVHLPGKAGDYYGHNFREGEDAAYPIMLHELGHFVHHHLVERHAYIGFCYQKLAGGSHATWTADPDLTAVGSEHISFAESTADFFATLVWRFWLDRHPEMADSMYARSPGDLADFATDEAAMAALEGGAPGSMVEGIQTRFLCVFYGRDADRRPAAVFDDYLSSMLLYMDRPTGAFEGLVNRPARTIQQWVDSKRRLPGAFGPADVLPLAARYKLLPGADPTPTASPPWGEPPASVRLDGRLVDVDRFPMVGVPEGSRLKTGDGTLSLDLSTVDRRQTAILEPNTEIMLQSRTEIVIRRGAVSVDFPVTLRTPGGAVIPEGTAVRVEVDDDGNAVVELLHGAVKVDGDAGGSRRLEAGQRLTLTADGELGPTTAGDAEALRQRVMPEGELPPLPAPRRFTLDRYSLWEKAKQLPWWALLAAGLGLVMAASALLWLLRRFLLALLSAPLIAAAVTAIGMLLLSRSGPEGMGFAELLLAPWSAWQDGHHWLPAAAWAIAGLAAGLIVGGPARGMITGALAPLAPWFLLHRPPLPEATTQQLAASSPHDLVALIAVAMLGATLGGLLRPHRRREHPSSAKRHYAAARRSSDGGWDWDDGGDD